MQSSRDAEFWSGFAGTYDGHVASREARVLIPRMVTALAQRKHVLDLGCGTGDVALALAKSAERVRGVDFAAGMIELAKQKAATSGVENVAFSVEQADVLPFPDGTFDAVVMANVLHVMERPDQALREAARVLQPRGILLAPTYCHGQNLKSKVLSRLTVLLFGLRVHNRWDDEGVLARIRQAGFGVEEHAMLPLRMPLVYVQAIKV